MFTQCLLFLLLQFCTIVRSKCYNDIMNEGEILCQSIEDVKLHQGKFTDILRIIPESERKRLGILKTNAFNNAPQLTKLSIISSVHEIEENALSNLPNLNKLVMKKNNIENLPVNFIPPSVENVLLIKNNIVNLARFYESSKLILIDLDDNNVSVVPSGVFSESFVEKLYLAANNIKQIEMGAFVNMKKLDKLVLALNKIDDFNSGYIFGTSYSLEYLDLASNKLKRIHERAFSTLINLKVLDLRENLIETIAPFAFSSLFRLSTLHLARNRLLEFQPDVLSSNHPSLKQLYLSFNNLTFLPLAVLIASPGLTKISIHGNPWQCPCWHRLRQQISKRMINVTVGCNGESHLDDFINGKIPTCVAHSDSSTECEETLKYTQEFSDIYYSSLSKYHTKLKCRIK